MICVGKTVLRMETKMRFERKWFLLQKYHWEPKQKIVAGRMGRMKVFVLPLQQL